MAYLLMNNTVYCVMHFFYSFSNVLVVSKICLAYRCFYNFYNLSYFTYSFTAVHKTEVIKNTLNPTWKPFKVLARVLCNGDYDRYISFFGFPLTFYLVFFWWRLRVGGVLLLFLHLLILCSNSCRQDSIVHIPSNLFQQFKKNFFYCNKLIFKMLSLTIIIWGNFVNIYFCATFCIDSLLVLFFGGRGGG